MPQLRAYYDVDTGTVFATDEAFKVNMSKVIPQGLFVFFTAVI